MKKKYIYVGMITVIFVLVVTLLNFGLSNYDQFEEFSVLEYQTFIKEFPSDKIIGEIPDAKTVKTRAEKIWNEIYGEDVKNSRPYKVYFDPRNEIWLVTGTLPKYMVGGVPYILIQKDDGKVLAIWHTK